MPRCRRLFPTGEIVRSHGKKSAARILPITPGNLGQPFSPLLCTRPH
ncbi:hypothetical protein B4113_0576 [Geobacillus sp. B4113_201601]|nr:hypothetical protein B4113_0576 [Geobacillus sp. B4113_201601]